MTVPVVGTVVIVSVPRLVRARSRPSNPRRVLVLPEYVTLGAVVAVATGVGVGAVAGFGSSADAGTADRSPTASANKNFFMLLPPETVA
jgi:hypothetical protein